MPIIIVAYWTIFCAFGGKTRRINATPFNPLNTARTVSVCGERWVLSRSPDH